MKGYGPAIILAGAAVLGAAAFGKPQTSVEPPRPVARWAFENVQAGRTEDPATGVRDEVRGRFRLLRGVSGRAIKFDGYTTCVVRKADEAPRLAAAFTVDAWVALAAFPWNWCPVLGQEKDGQTGYSFGIGPRGEFGLKVSVRGEWLNCVSPARLALKRWTHIAATFDAGDGIKVYMDGAEVARCPGRGPMAYAANADLLIGANPEKRKPAAIVGQGVGTVPGWFAIDGIMDEIRVFDKALGAEELKRVLDSPHPVEPPDLPARVLPSGPPGPGRFGATYAKLRYDEDWDSLWPVGPAADVVVRFDDSPVRVVFWRGTRYSPAWVMENGQWLADQSVEAWDDQEGCYEHMEDPRCLFSQVRILESTEARAVVHWRYAPVSSRGHFWRVDEKTSWGLWVDEYYTFYPDGTAVRKVVWPTKSLGDESSSEIQETIPLCQPGEGPADILDPAALVLVNMKGETAAYSWPGPWNDPGSRKGILPEKANIQVVNLKSRFKPFMIFEPGCRMHVYVGRVRKDVSDFSAYNHWPVSLLPSDGRFAVAADRVTSFSISFTDPPRHEEPDGTTWASWLYGAAERPAEKLAALGRSWASAPGLVVKEGNVRYAGYDISQRAYVLESPWPAASGPAEIGIAASPDSPLHNFCLVIKGWGGAGARIDLDGKTLGPADGLRIGRVPTLTGSDLVVWVEAVSVKPVRVRVL